MPIITKELEREYKSVEPFRTYLRLLGIPVWEHLRLLMLFLIKQAPILVFPLVIAESIRIADSDMSEPWEYLIFFYGAYLVLLFSNVPFHMWFIRGSSRATRNMELRLRAALVRRLQQLSMHFHSERETGRLQSKVLRDVDEIVRFSEVYFNASMGAILSIVFAVTYTLIQEPLVALGYLIATPLAVGLIRIFRDAMRKRNDALRHEFEGMSQRVSEMIDMVPVTRAHGVEQQETENVQRQLEHVRERGQRVDSINAIFGANAFVVFMFAVLLITMGVTWMVIQGHASLDKIALYSALFQMVVGSVQQLLNLMPQFSKSMASVRSIGEILECPDLEENEGKTSVTSVGGCVDFRNVNFHYHGQDRPAVSNFSLSVKPGTCVAFVGESGSGKSTLMQLAIGFLRPQSGQILLDGLPMESIDMRSWRRHIAMVPQQTILFSGTIRDNVGYGLDPFTDEDIWNALDVANLRGVINDLPQKLDTPVGENGLKLSGGQRQRLAIARAVIRNPQVIILDEATSALDVISEREVQSAIENLIRGRTTFIVAHRLSTIRNANLVVVMKEGEAIEVGPPEELTLRNGAFKELQTNSAL
ncbi:ABC transporter ATP-binding protein [Puniceicoccus vermicola]|uniref:ABC transporter ATP-binding protein n=1 Tax=Puniceicoccus vermicola TaxID=388746 RepID=A0A7X1B167_9BACT|nr:ABC transporter ATP-binding protein [Puniceicoccus vermicola]MBC2603730.1 ABC transporter ATP-binding protein [Puniceicoccus vermicola]